MLNDTSVQKDLCGINLANSMVISALEPLADLEDAPTCVRKMWNFHLFRS